jgi:hypothetical protein
MVSNALINALSMWRYTWLNDRAGRIYRSSLLSKFTDAEMNLNDQRAGFDKGGNDKLAYSH